MTLENLIPELARYANLPANMSSVIKVLGVDICVNW